MGDGEQGLKDHAKQRIEGERPEGQQLFKMRLWAVQPASQMCTHHKALYEIFTPSAPQHEVYFR